LWKPAGEPFTSLAEEAAWWVGNIRTDWENAGKPIEEALIDAATSMLEELAPTQGEQVLVHQDLHPDNVLAAEREPWLVIDPKPLVGEREFALASIIRASELDHSKGAVIGRLDRLTSELDLDRERARGWAIGQTIAWAGYGDFHAVHAETARWLVEAGR
jgi:streptomycin 6-kinase